MNLNTAVSHFATAVGPLVTGSIVGEQVPGGHLLVTRLPGIIAALFGICALLLSFRLQSFTTSSPR